MAAFSEQFRDKGLNLNTGCLQWGHSPEFTYNHVITCLISRSRFSSVSLTWNQNEARTYEMEYKGFTKMRQFGGTTGKNMKTGLLSASAISPQPANSGAKWFMTRKPMRHQLKLKAISSTSGSVFALYLFLAVIAIPAGIDRPGHYNNGNTLVGDVFLSYATLTAPLSPLVAMAMYSTYTYIALVGRRRMGLILFAVHYGFALAVAVPFHLHRFPGLAQETALQFTELMARPRPLSTVRNKQTAWNGPGKACPLEQQ
jgi:hypothetical protein